MLYSVLRDAIDKLTNASYVAYDLNWTERGSFEAASPTIGYR